MQLCEGATGKVDETDACSTRTDVEINDFYNLV